MFIKAGFKVINNLTEGLKTSSIVWTANSAVWSRLFLHFFSGEHKMKGWILHSQMTPRSVWTWRTRSPRCCSSWWPDSTSGWWVVCRLRTHRLTRKVTPRTGVASGLQGGVSDSRCLKRRMIHVYMVDNAVLRRSHLLSRPLTPLLIADRKGKAVLYAFYLHSICVPWMFTFFIQTLYLFYVYKRL